MRRILAAIVVLLVLGLGPVQAQPVDPGVDTSLEEAADAPAAQPTAPAVNEPVATTPVAVPVVSIPAEDPALSRVMGHVIDIIAAVLGTLLIALVGIGMRYFSKKTGIEIPARMEELVRGVADDAINYADEQAHKYLKEHGKALETSKKLEAGLGFGLSVAEEHKLPTLAREKLTKYIESRLGATR